MIKDLVKAKDRVEFLLEKLPAARDCDKTLWLAYLVMYHGLRKKLGDEAYEALKETLFDKDTCTMESIRRMRQKFQEEGKFIGRKRALRLEEAEIVRELMR